MDANTVNNVAGGVGYTLIADAGMELIAVDESGNELARTKEVVIPSGQTGLNWQEVFEKTVDIVPTIIVPAKS